MRRLVFIFICVAVGAASTRHYRHSKHSSAAGSLQCKDENGNDVDWFVVYKIPETYHSPKTLLDGAGYMYITSETSSKGWTVPSKTMENDTNLIAKTIANMYTDSAEELWLVYNDQEGEEEEFDKTNAQNINYYTNAYYSAFGHTKGIVGAKEDGGFWLIHSIPHFPVLEKYEYPKTALRYGQSAMCISLSAAELDKVGNAFKYNVPDFEKNKYSDALGAKYPNLKAAAEGEKARKAPWNYGFELTSKAGVKFSGFAKGRSFGKDLYEWVAAALDTDMYAETWQNEPEPLPASCSIERKVMNVKQITYSPGQVDFNSHKDHSKWAISASSTKPFVCIGDINRAIPQEKRGGGTVCVSDKGLWEAYNKLITDKDSCNNV